MKRSTSSSPSSPITPSKKQKSIKKESPSSSTDTSPTPSPSKTKNQKSNQGGNGEWTLEKRAGVAEDVIAAGYKAINVDDLCTKYGLTEAQILNQLTPARNNLRSKLVKAAGEA